MTAVRVRLAHPALTDVMGHQAVLDRQVLLDQPEIKVLPDRLVQEGRLARLVQQVHVVLREALATLDKLVQLVNAETTETLVQTRTHFQNWKLLNKCCIFFSLKYN